MTEGLGEQVGSPGDGKGAKGMRGVASRGNPNARKPGQEPRGTGDGGRSGDGGRTGGYPGSGGFGRGGGKGGFGGGSGGNGRNPGQDRRSGGGR